MNNSFKLFNLMSNISEVAALDMSSTNIRGLNRFAEATNYLTDES